MNKKLVCYAEGHDGQWQAFCPDFDLAVQGRTFEEVYAALRVAILEYIEAAQQEDPMTRDRLLNRRTPIAERVRLFWRYVSAVFRSSNREATHGFTVACPA
jgi:predicted RNase H-like HicB family nuclease